MKAAVSNIYLPIQKLLMEKMRWTYILHCVGGSVFLALMSQLSIRLPFTPVPITLQTFALFLLVLSQGKNKATLSVALYLAQATAGLPVLSGGIPNALWFASPVAGYLIGFLGCTYLAGYMIERKSSPGFLWILLSLACGQLFIYLAGTAYLSSFVGLDKAFQLGVLPFLSGTALKLLAAACSAKPIQWVRSLLEI